MLPNFTPSAVTDLAALVTNNALASQYETYVNQRIRQGTTFYSRILNSKGKEAAEAALLEWNRRDRQSDFAAAVAPVVHGLYAIWQMNNESVKVVAAQEGNDFPRSHDIINPDKMFVFFNQPLMRLGSLPAEGDWGPSGKLGLKAITLQAGLNRDYQVAAELGLVMALRGSDYSQKDDGYVVASIELTGSTRANSYEPTINKQGFLMHKLGLLGAERAINCLQSGSTISDSILGFPGARDYLANRLPTLALYLSGLAEVLSKSSEE